MRKRTLKNVTEKSFLVKNVAIDFLKRKNKRNKNKENESEFKISQLKAF